MVNIFLEKVAIEDCKFSYNCFFDPFSEVCFSRTTQEGCNEDLDNFYNLFQNDDIIRDYSSITNTYNANSKNGGCNFVVSGYLCDELRFMSIYGSHFQNANGRPVAG
jgi:hypothetical protein